MRDQITLDGGQVVEHGLPSADRVARLDCLQHARVLIEFRAVKGVAVAGAAWRLAEDAPVIGQLEEQVATALEGLDQRGILAKADQPQMKQNVRLVERGDIGGAHLVEDVVDGQQIIAVPMLGGQLDGLDFEELARRVHVADRDSRGERGDVHIFGAQQGVVGDDQAVALPGDEAAGDQAAQSFADGRAADAEGQTDVLLGGHALPGRQRARQDLAAKLGEQALRQGFTLEDLAGSAHYLFV